MRYIRYVSIFISLFIATSCAIDELETSLSLTDSSEEITVLGQITRFEDCDVATKSAKSEAESKIKTMAMAIFPVNESGNALAGGCVHYEYISTQSQLIFTLDRANFTEGQRYAVYVFANMPGLADFQRGTTLGEILAASYDVNDLNIPADGFPMIGSLGDTFSTAIDQDGKELILRPASNGGETERKPIIKTTDPETGESTTTEVSVLPVAMKVLYAKINFTIQVTPSQTVQGNLPPQFTLEGYTINNVPNSVDFDLGTTAANNPTMIGYLAKPVDVAMSATANSTRQIKFSFYLPENLLEPEYNPTTYAYPFKGSYSTDLDKDQNGIRDQDEILRQRFKPELLGDKKATSVVISGQYRDHQQQFHDVDYTIYLGKDAYGDFNVCRNLEYNNVISICDVKNSNESTQGGYSIDHRVNITRTQPAIISLRREVLLDSHFEIRPLRIRKSEVKDVGAINAIQVQVVNPTTTDWMRLERSFGDGTVDGASSDTYITTDSNSASYGKRKYFTYNLVTSTLSLSDTVNVPINTDGECVWIYIDECVDVGDGVRSGTIRLIYGTLTKVNGREVFTPANDPSFPDVVYTINQRKLFKVSYDDNNTPNNMRDDQEYYIEYEEEYLHNFDSATDFGEDVIDAEGMAWGLNNINISSKYESLKMPSGSLVGVIIEYLKTGDTAKYDFYLERDNTETGTTRPAHNGYTFCNEIIASPDVNIDKLDLASKPQSAVEYCYNKNKREEDGTVHEVNWFLPAIDELEEIMQSKYSAEGSTFYTYSRFSDFQNKYYWSSMPAYERNLIDYNIWSVELKGTFYRDDITRARATKVNLIDKDSDEFEIPKSGLAAEKYINTLYIRELKNLRPVISLNPTTQRNKTGLFKEPYDETIYEEGNKPRTSMARVRCIRKAPPPQN